MSPKGDMVLDSAQGHYFFKDKIFALQASDMDDVWNAENPYEVVETVL